jgi:1-acyl-sn-glycerol-3-phosphate acyltransferase
MDLIAVSPRVPSTIARTSCRRSTVLWAWFHVRISGRENIPVSRPVILTPNHKNFLDAYFVGLATNRHIRFMAKAELFKGPVAWLFLRLGALPVRRGEADQDAVETAPRSSPAAWW